MLSSQQSDLDFILHLNDYLQELNKELQPQMVHLLESVEPFLQLIGQVQGDLHTMGF